MSAPAPVDAAPSAGPATAPADQVAPPRGTGRLEVASGWMLGSAGLLAAMGAATHGLRGEADWGVVALVRAGVMLTTALVLCRAARVRLAITRPRSLWIRSLAGSFSLVCNFYALTALPVADAVILSNLHPLWIVALTALMARRLPAGSEVLGLLSGLLGVALIERPDLAHAQHGAVAVAVVSSISTAVAMLGLHRLRGIDPRAIVAHFAATASLVALTLLLIRWPTWQPTQCDATTVARLLGVGVLGTGAQVCLTRAYAAGAPSRVAVVGLTQVVFALGFDAGLFGRHLDLTTLVGFALVLGPTTWLSVRSARQGQRAAQSPGAIAGPADSAGPGA